MLTVWTLCADTGVKEAEVGMASNSTIQAAVNLHNLYVYKQIMLTVWTLCCATGVKEPEVDTASNSTIEPDTDFTKMTENELTVKLYQLL